MIDKVIEVIVANLDTYAINTSFLPSTKIIHRISSISLLFLGTILMGSCSQSHRLGVAENPREILDAKLANPKQKLSTQKSIALMQYCAELGATERSSYY
jgi:hypothetical protein